MQLNAVKCLSGGHRSPRIEQLTAATQQKQTPAVRHGSALAPGLPLIEANACRSLRGLVACRCKQPSLPVWFSRLVKRLALAEAHRWRVASS